VLEAQAAKLVEGVEASVDRASDDDHPMSPQGSVCRTHFRHSPASVASGQSRIRTESRDGAAAATKAPRQAATSG
jgi:hypothetical protein